ncbi:MAG TPA: carboxypeptidase regulatory-like domain-containing protein [Terracidiphilus sp.]|nr:carboxypeptidase regulatory-like domain-containing protein [Terracidiphilus sp.]
MKAKSLLFPRKSLAKAAASMIALAFIVCSSAQLHAQGYGTISGAITDPSGALVASATVTATQTQTGRETLVNTNREGIYVFPSLLPTEYSITVAAPGFESYTQMGVVLQANQALTVNISLRVGATTQSVSVTSETPQVDTTTGTLSQVIDVSRVLEMPLNGRNAASLITLVAGVSDATAAGNGVDQGMGKTFPAAVVTTSNGTLPNQSNYLLNGGNNVDEMTNVNGPFPFPDALQEFSVQTSNADASFGQSAGAVVNIVTKSGGSDFHGSAFEFLRNGYFNAKQYFATKADTLHRHQFGGTIGGPVIIPYFSEGKRTQFFFGYQHTQIHNSSTGNQVQVPTLAEKGLDSSGNKLSFADYGNLCNTALGHSFNGSGLCVDSTGTPIDAEQIRNPFSNAIYAYNRIPSADFDPASVAYEKLFPSVSTDAGAGKIGNTYNYLRATVNNYNEYIGRVDHQFGANDHLFGHYFQDWFQQPAIYDPKMLQSYTSYFNTRYHNALLAETHTFSPSLLNNLVLNYQRIISLRGGPPGSPKITDFGVQNIWQPPTGPYLSANITNYFGATSSAFAGWLRNNYTFNDDLHWTIGAHNLTFGGHFELSKYDVTNVYQSYGGFGFAPITNKIGGVSYQYPNAMANFLVGFMSAFNQGNYELLNDRNHFPAVYAQDSWRLTRRLTLNYGVRWEMFAPWANRIGVQTAFSPANYAANKSTAQYNTLPAGMVISGDPGFPKNGVRNKYAQFMPRFGFAYDLFGNAKTVVRGGFGIFFQNRMPGFFNLNQAGFVPNTISVTLNTPGMYGSAPGVNPGGPFSNPYCTGCTVGAYTNPFPFSLPFPASQTFPNAFQLGEYDPSGDFRVPVTYSYNLTIERELGAGFATRVAYVGSGSHHQFVNLEINPSVNTGSGLSTNQRRVYNTAPTVGPCTTGTGCATRYSNIIQAAMVGNANYNSLQLTLSKKMSHGLSLLANYTWSKTLDDLPQATRVSNTEDLNAGESYVYPLYPSNATGIPAAAYVQDIKALDRGLSDIDHPHLVSISYVYELPKLNSDNRMLRAVANGWRTSGAITHRSGDSLTAWMGRDISLTGLGQDRAVRDLSKPAYSRDNNGAGDCPSGKLCVNWLNNAAFSVPVNTGVGTGFGNVVKGSLRGPGYTNWDGAVTRSFPIVREMNLEFRVEYFNLLNHTQLANPNTADPNPSSTTFGTITRVPTGANPRTAQFALKFTF